MKTLIPVLVILALAGATACSGGDGTSFDDPRPTAAIIVVSDTPGTETGDTCKFVPPEDFKKVTGMVDFGPEGWGDGTGVAFNYIEDGQETNIYVPLCARNQALTAYRNLYR